MLPCIDLRAYSGSRTLVMSQTQVSQFHFVTLLARVRMGHEQLSFMNAFFDGA